VTGLPGQALGIHPRVQPGTEEHRQRNRKNRCPSKIPSKCEGDKFRDSEGNDWKSDWWGDNLTHTGEGYRTFRRLDPENIGAGFQCTYDKNGNLVRGEGTYDYDNPGQNPIGHWANDVWPGLWDNKYETPDPTITY
jgi:hypothetical protein